MSIRHRIKDSDTLEYLSNLYYGTASRWQEIADYNNLVYPYLSGNPEDKYKTYATGFVRVTRDNARQPVTIRKYWQVQTKRSVLSATLKTYSILEDLTLATGEYEGYIRVRALIPGIQGNASEGTITELGEDFAKNDINISIVNDIPVKGGTEGFVRVTGEYVFIPDDDDAQMLSDYDTRFTYDQLRYFYGEDLKLEDSDLSVSLLNGDLATVGYMENVEQAINRRFETEIGDMLASYDFGNKIADIIGDNSLHFEAKKRLVKLEIMQTLAEEDRISDPVIDSIIVVPQELSCRVNISAKVVNMGTFLKLENLVLGGMS
jgi:hypothetical protein